ncbi:MAG TPA: coniferyl aldehyde dehydrogenase [Polyangiaceae bacterium]
MTTSPEVIAPEPKSEEKETREAEKKSDPASGETNAKVKTKAPTSMRDRLAKMKAAQRKAGPPTYEQRLDALDRLEKMLLGHKHDFVKAISEDFGNRSKHETLLAEVFITHGSIKYAREHLREWMDVEPRDVGAVFLPARVEVMNQPLGVVGIISPWNYPMQLALSPLAGALAAGNRAMIKPSELVPATSALLAKLVGATFSEDEVCVVEGGVDIGAEFATLPFDHLVFTGSTRVGKIVMKAAAENLTPVTLELGGKSPTIVADDFSIDEAAITILNGKLLNAGQTCIAPDYVLVPKAKLDAFVEACKTSVAKMYPKLGSNDDYTSIVNEQHYKRLTGYLDDAKAKGAKIVEINPGGETLDAGKRKIAPTLVVTPAEDTQIMQEEIFGPILPVKTYDKLEDAIDYVNDHPRPLALYLFSHDSDKVEAVLEKTVSGGVSINATMLHIAQDDVPFGGVGPSGMGHYHGKEGFDTFTKKKAVFYQGRLNGAALLRPPYGKVIDLLLGFLIGK